jgi:hypothetical protein
VLDATIRAVDVDPAAAAAVLNLDGSNTSISPRSIWDAHCPGRRAGEPWRPQQGPGHVGLQAELDRVLAAVGERLGTLAGEPAPENAPPENAAPESNLAEDDR